MRIGDPFLSKNVPGKIVGFEIQVLAIFVFLGDEACRRIDFDADDVFRHLIPAFAPSLEIVFHDICPDVFDEADL